MAEEGSDKRVYVGLYITFCIVFITWLTSKFFRGRRQVHLAFDTIGERLQRLQEQLDQRQREMELKQIDNNKNGSEKLCPVVESDGEKAEAEETDKLKEQ